MPLIQTTRLGRSLAAYDNQMGRLDFGDDSSDLTAAKVAAAAKAKVIVSVLSSTWLAAYGIAAATNFPNRANALNALSRDKEYIDKLNGEYFAWASNGKRADGTSYDWARWFDFAKTVMDDMVYQTRVNAGDFYNLGITLKDISAEIGDLAYRLAKKLKEGVEAGLATPWWVYALVGAGVLGVVFAPEIKAGIGSVRRAMRR